VNRQRPSTLYLLHQTSQGMRSRLEHALRPLGITGLQYTVLGLLDRHAGLSSADLSRRFFVTPQTMSQVVAGMTKRGLIARQASSANRRILQMALTPEGRDLLSRADAVADATEADALADVPETDLMQMRQHLQFLLRRLRLVDGGEKVFVEPLHNGGLEEAAAEPRSAHTREKRLPSGGVNPRLQRRI